MRNKYRLIIVLVAFLFSSVMYGQEKGKASYYSHSLQGHRMSDGSKYHRDSLVCAHKRYPMGTMLKVTNSLSHFMNAGLIQDTVSHS